MKEWITSQYVYNEETGGYEKINAPRIQAETWEDAERIASKSGCVIVGEHIIDVDDQRDNTTPQSND